jgi:hypothetical protein
LTVIRSLLFSAVVCLPPCLPAAEPISGVKCEGTYNIHLQGVCTNERDAIYWCFTDTLVKTDFSGTVLKKIPVGNHHGDLCHAEGKIYVAVNFGKFNDPQQRADSWVYVYDAETLRELAKHKVPELVYGAGGMAHHAGKFLVVGGLPGDLEENYVYEYDPEFRFVKRHVLPSGQTRLGIQTAEFAHGKWWFGCYGSPQILLVANEELTTVERYEFECSLGIVAQSDGSFLVARGRCSKETGCVGELVKAQPDSRHGLVIVRE